MKVKICGMKYRDNLEDIAALAPDYLGFIYYKRSPRYMADTLSPNELEIIPPSVGRVGVFVNEDIEVILNTVLEYSLDGIQLHGDEKPAYTSRLKPSLDRNTRLIKAFGIDGGFNWSSLNDYKDYCDVFLFDTKTPNYGGSGLTFDYSLLRGYKLDLPFWLGGGIGADNVQSVLDELETFPETIDMNSRLEIKPGWKEIEKVDQAIKKVRAYE